VNDGTYLVAYCKSGCVVGWSSLKPSMLLIDVQKFASTARQHGYRIDEVSGSGGPPEYVNLWCGHR